MSYDASVCGVFDKLLCLPEKILLHHEIDALPQIVLHDLSHDDVFGLDKAVYLVDNPDFDCLKGVAGFSRDECKLHHQNLWEKPNNFRTEMKDAVYNESMQSFLRNGIRRKDINTHDEDDLVELGKSLGMQSPSFLTWNMRHGNHGILIFETTHQAFSRKKDLLKQAGPLLSLC